MARKVKASTLLWEKKKAQTRKAVEAVCSLSASRMADISAPGGFNEIVSLCHILDHLPSSPLLVELIKKCESSQATVALKPKVQSLYKRLRPPSNLDLDPSPKSSAPLVFSNNQDRRSLPGVTKIKEQDFVALVVDAIVCVGRGAEKAAFDFANEQGCDDHEKEAKVSRNKKEEEEEEEEGKDQNENDDINNNAAERDLKTVDVKIKALIKPGDSVFLPEDRSSNVGESRSKKKRQQAVAAHTVEAINYVDGGVMLTSKETRSARKPPVFFPLISLYDKVVARREIVGEVKKVTAFKVPPPSIAVAYKKLKSLGDEDTWKNNLNTSTHVIQEEQRRVAKLEGEKHYQDEKEAKKIALDLLKVIPVSMIVNNRSLWLKVGRAMNAISKDLLEAWAAWSCSSSEIAYCRRNCLVAWERFRPR